MNALGFKFPIQERKTALYNLEENWYLPLLAEKRGLSLQNIKRSNFGQYSMAVNYLTSVLEEAAAINKVAVYNIDHMAQLYFYGWANVSETDFEKWALIDVAKYKMYVDDCGGLDKIGKLKFNNKHGKASFYAIPINKLTSCFVTDYKKFIVTEAV